jgi:hypothetical protein
MYSTRFSRRILTKFEFSRQIFQKYLNIEVSWKSVQCEPSCFTRTDGRTEEEKDGDSHDEANSRFSQFYERA